MKLFELDSKICIIDRDDILLKGISGIYCILNKTNNKYYIGSAKDLLIRIQYHINKLNNNQHHNIHLQRAYDKYKQESFEFLVIEECEVYNLINREQYYIDLLNPEYNICKIANSSIGIKRRKETIEKVRLKKLGYKDSNETKLKKSISFYKNFNGIGNRKGAKINQELKDRISKNSAKHLSKKTYKLDLNGNIIKEYQSAKDAAIEHNISAYKIRTACDKYREEIGYYWKYNI